MTWMSTLYTKAVCLFNLLAGVWLPSMATPCWHHRHRAYMPTHNIASHDKHEEMNSQGSFSFLYKYGAPFGGAKGYQSSAVNATLGVMCT